MLRAEGLCKRYPTRAGELVVLRDISLTLKAGQSAAILGPSGSGKSTLLNILGTLEPASSGTVNLDGFDLAGMLPVGLAAFRNRQVGFIFQDHHLLPQCSALENVLIPTLVQRTDPNVEKRACELLAQIGLAGRLYHRPAELSGGEKQRVAIARALINQPRLVLADEPTGNLDRVNAERIGELLAALPREQEVILLVVTHGERLAERFDLRFELVEGRLRALPRVC